MPLITLEHSAMADRAQGCLLGQMCGDALGAHVEFKSSRQMTEDYPHGLREMISGGAFRRRAAGQITDDSELALALARTLVKQQCFDPVTIMKAYQEWLKSEPFDMGYTTEMGLKGNPDPSSQSNGALMRICPLGIFAALQDEEVVADWARQDARLTHIHPVCAEANALFTVAIAFSIRSPRKPEDVYYRILERAQAHQVPESLRNTVTLARNTPPHTLDDHHQGWVLYALHNALWQLLHANNPEEAIVSTVQFGGDTDTNAAICGALLGAVHGIKQWPQRWVQCVTQFSADRNNPSVLLPRPRIYWTTDAFTLADDLLKAGQKVHL